MGRGLFGLIGQCGAGGKEKEMPICVDTDSHFVFLLSLPLHPIVFFPPQRVHMSSSSGTSALTLTTFAMMHLLWSLSSGRSLFRVIFWKEQPRDWHRGWASVSFLIWKSLRTWVHLIRWGRKRCYSYCSVCMTESKGKSEIWTCQTLVSILQAICGSQNVKCGPKWNTYYSQGAVLVAEVEWHVRPCYELLWASTNARRKFTGNTP